jgi:hypothetical protein
MLQKLRVRTLAKFIAEYGEDRLIEALGNNEAGGMVYHYPGELVGDYDKPQSEDEIRQLILKGLRGTPRQNAEQGDRKTRSGGYEVIR